MKSVKKTAEKASKDAYPLKKFIPSRAEDEAYYNAAQTKLQDAFVRGVLWYRDELVEWAKAMADSIDCDNYDEYQMGLRIAYTDLVKKLQGK